MDERDSMDGMDDMDGGIEPARAERGLYLEAAAGRETSSKWWGKIVG